ncbi:MAG: acylphosphatase [Pseudomonadota bacterium]
MDRTRVHLIIEGRVQGVWFRESTRREAVSRRLFGWVRNRPDGKVEALIEGPADQVKNLVSWCQKGPSAARVAAVHEQQEKWQGEFTSFDIVF